MDLATITPLVLTYNEAPNLRRCLESVSWASDIVVVDSHSSDETVSIAESYSHVRVVQRAFDAHARQWSFGLRECGIASEWVLGMDADYALTPELLDEIHRLTPPTEVSAYRVPFSYRVFGRRLRGNVYKSVAVLFRREMCGYVQDGHTHRLEVRCGQTVPLRAPMIHDDRKPLARWLASQSNYMDLECRKLLNTPRRELGWPDRLRLWLIPAPLAMLAYCLVVQRGLLDGWAGWYYAFQRLAAESILSLKLLEARLRRREPVALPTEPALPQPNSGERP